jgi:penicillin G amidase
MRNRIVATAITIVILIVYLPAQPFAMSEAQAQFSKSPFTKQVLNFNGEEIVIIRDSFGVPHLKAITQKGLYYGNGYAVAQDRLRQLDMFRRDARAGLAETEGQRALFRDQQMRMIGYTEAELQAQFDGLKETTKQIVQAYADGINAYNQQLAKTGKLPDTFLGKARESIEPWKLTDSIAIMVMLSNRFSTEGGAEFLNANLLKKLQEKFGEKAGKIFNDILWFNDPKSPTTIPDDTKTALNQSDNAVNPQALPVKKLDEKILAEAYSVASQSAELKYAAENKLPTKWGSYSWVVAPQRSASGSAILLAGPQMGFSTPQIAHEIHLTAGDLNAIGMGIAGVPGILIGHNDKLAWSTTSGGTDVVDIFAEKLNPANKYQYWYKGKYQNMERRVEVFKVKGGQQQELEICRTVHGPVIGWDEKAGVAYTRAASHGGREAQSFEAILAFSYASNIEQFAAAAEQIYVNHNFLLATASGDIAYYHCGRPPIRARGYDPRLPAPGTGEYDWVGFMQFAKMPQVVNPKQGFIANWNNKPARTWDNGDTPFWGEIFHVRRIEQIIKSQPRLTFEQVRDIAQDISDEDVNAVYLKPYLLAAIEKTGAATRDGRINEAANYLRAWNNRYVDKSVAKTILDTWISALREEIFADELKDLNVFNATHWQTHLFRQFLSVSFILHVLDGPKSGVPPSQDYFNGKGKEQVIVAALSKAIDLLTQKRGPQMNFWEFDQSEFNLSPLPGIPDTDRATYLLAIELSKPLFKTASVLLPGQSEDSRSPHYGDQREMAGYWRLKPLLYKWEQLEKRAPAN